MCKWHLNPAMTTEKVLKALAPAFRLRNLQLYERLAFQDCLK